MTRALPSGYALLSAATVRAAVRRDLVPTLGPWLLRAELEMPPDAEPIASGRGAAYRALLPGGVRAVVRPYRRGGLVARVVRRTYVGRWPRPLRELVLTAEARRRGVAVPEVLAARVEGGVAYRGALVTAEVPWARPLLEALRAADPATRRLLAATAGRAVGAMHEAGVFHADLNLDNILIDAREGGATATVIDLDRARLTSGPLSRQARRRNLRRLERSVRKLDPRAAVFGPESLAGFREGYASVTGGRCAS